MTTTFDLYFMGARPLSAKGTRRMSDTERDGDEISLDAVVDILRARGCPAYVEQTGGGCATIYAGPQYHDTEGNLRWAAVAGPGWFEPHWGAPGATAWATSHEFSVGYDDGGDAPAVFWDLRRLTPSADFVADVIQNVCSGEYLDVDGTPFSADFVDACGLDSSLRDWPTPADRRLAIAAAEAWRRILRDGVLEGEGAPATFVDLHDVCDANEYLIVGAGAVPGYKGDTELCEANLPWYGRLAGALDGLIRQRQGGRR